MENNNRIPINVTVSPSDYSGHSIRLGNSGNNSDIREKMNQRMREFEEESRKWRDQFNLQRDGNLASPLTSLNNDHHRPRMLMNFPEFPELSSNLGFRGGLGSNRDNFFPAPVGGSFAQTSHKSFIEEDDNGRKKYKMVFEIGDFKPNEIKVKTEGRQLIINGDREQIAGSAMESKQFNKEITLPDFIEPTSVVSFLSDGVLTLEAPVIVDRLGLTSGSSGLNNNSNISSSSSSSAVRHSPFRDTGSPARIGNTSMFNSSNSSSSRNYRSANDDLLTKNQQYPFSSPFFTESPLATAASSPSSYNNNNNKQSARPIASTTVSTGSPQSTPATFKFNMAEFRPEDIAITVTDTTLKIHAVREEADSHGAGKTYREFKREIGLPQGADVKRLRNSLQSDGTLSIEIPVQDNSNLRPPLSPSGINKSFGDFTLNEPQQQSSSAIENSNYRSSNQHHHHQQQQQQQQQRQDHQQHQISSLNSNNNGLIDQSNNGKELKLTFDLTGYKPEDLSIKVIDNNTLKVHAVHIDNTRGNQIHREYTRQYILPNWVQPELLRARMSDNGTLTVEIPLPQVQPSKYERVINIQGPNR
jgi:HSP20 family molecular chaperone IbpA